MKTLSSIICILYCTTLLSQKIQGLYQSTDDFTNNMLSFTKKRSGYAKITSGLQSNKSFIKVKYNDSIYIFKKENLFGYMDKEGLCYRLYQNTAFNILNPNEKILVYKKEFNVGTPKYPNIFTGYYFSKTPGSEIQELTLNNLLSAFTSDSSFTNLIELHFKSDKELTEFDNYHGIYKLNRLLEISTNNKNK